MSIFAIRREPSRHARKRLAELGFMADSNLVVGTYTHEHRDCGASAGVPVLSEEDEDGIGVYCGGEFVCSRCKTQVGWCFGCADDATDGLCDDCAFDVLGRCRPDVAQQEKLAAAYETLAEILPNDLTVRSVILLLLREHGKGL